jgi:hypothetical protein
LEKGNSHGGRGDRFEPTNRSRSWLQTRVDIWPFAGNGVARARVRIQGRVRIRLQKGIVVLIQDRREGTSRCRCRNLWYGANFGVARTRVRIQGRVQIRLRKGIVVLIQDRREGTSHCRCRKKEVRFEERMLGVVPRIVKPSARTETRNRSSKLNRNRGTRANIRKW